MKLLKKNENIIKRLKKQDRSAQKRFYDENAPQLLSVARMYIRDLHHAEDCLINAFCKIFKNIDSLRNNSGLQSWARRIVVNECLNFIKKQKALLYLDESCSEDILAEEETETSSDLDAQALIDELPENYRLVFNLYVLENYSHQEIANLLNISVSTSKTQLFRAKKKLREFIQHKKLMKDEI